MKVEKVLLFVRLCSLMMISTSGASIQECDFMLQCTCTRSMVTCVGVRIFSLRDVFERADYVSGDRRAFNQIVISRSGLLQVDWAPESLVTLSLPKNSIYRVDRRALLSSEDTLSSLDLSDNALSDLPNLADMKELRWLNLQRNQFSQVPFGVRASKLTTLSLSGNYISDVTLDQFPQSLTTLHLDSNQILSIEGHSIPSAVRLLNVANNFLQHIPQHFHHSNSLQRLMLNSNVIQRLPSQWKLPHTLEELNLSRGSLRQLRDGCLSLANGSRLYLRSLHLEFNFITSLSDNVFESVQLESLFLNSNRLVQLPERLFDGVIANSLLVLDLSENQFETLPNCVSGLKSLNSLLLKGNSLVNFELRAFPSFLGTLQVLDLAFNKLKDIPAALMNMTSLARLNLQSNKVDSLRMLSRGKWTFKLKSLILSNNAIKSVSYRDFSATLSLKELKLSSNNFQYLDVACFEYLKELQALEMSSSLADDTSIKRLSHLLRPLTQLRALQIDHDRAYGSDGVATTSAVSVATTSAASVPFVSTSSKVTRLSLSYNAIRSLRRGSLRNASSLEQLTLIGNPLAEVESSAISDMNSLVSVILSSNRIRRIHGGAFRNLPNLQRIHLENNLLQNFNFDMFRAAGRRLLLNASTNLIRSVAPADADPVDVRVVDLSHNELTALTDGFWSSTKGLVQLFAAKNRICQLFANGPAHEQLLIVDLSWNKLTAEAVSNLSLIAPFLEELHLKANGLESIASADSVALRRVSKWPLRVLDVSVNFVKRVTSSMMPSSLQLLNLSDNPLDSVDCGKLHELVELDVSRTAVRLDSIASSSQLQTLRLSSSRTEQLSSDTLPASLLVIGASGCRFSSISLNAPMLIELNLRATPLPATTSVNASRLRSLDLAQNSIRNLTALLMAFTTERLTRLWAERNVIGDISPQVWTRTPVLHTLDISSNPVDVLSAQSFRGLRHLAHLDMRNLSLVQLDPRVLSQIPCLSTLRISTYNEGIRSLRLQQLLAESQLRRVMVEVGEPVLSYQLQWAFANRVKLRELHVTGAPLRLILPDAFQGLESVHELSLRITHTSISELPPGLLRYLTDVRHLSLDLRYNQLQSISPAVLNSERLQPAQREPQLLHGGLRVDGNPWRCSCDLAWLASWLRRWMRETGRLQRFEASTALQLHQTVRRATCYLPTRRSIPIVELSFKEFECATTGASTNSTNELHRTIATCISFLLLIFTSFVYV